MRTEIRKTHWHPMKIKPIAFGYREPHTFNRSIRFRDHPTAIVFVFVGRFDYFPEIRMVSLSQIILTSAMNERFPIFVTCTVIAEIFVRDLISHCSYFRLKVRNLGANENHARKTACATPSSLYENL